MVLGITKETAIETAKTAAQTALIVGGIIAHAHPNPIVSAIGSIAASGTMAYIATKGLIKNKLATASVVATSALISVAQKSLWPIGQAAALVSWGRVALQSKTPTPAPKALAIQIKQPDAQPAPTPPAAPVKPPLSAQEELEKVKAPLEKDFFESKNSAQTDSNGFEITPNPSSSSSSALSVEPVDEHDTALGPVVSSVKKKRKTPAVTDEAPATVAKKKKTTAPRKNAESEILKQPVITGKRKRN